MLKITNKSNTDLFDRYDGQDYAFPAGKTVRCPLVVAKHIFGIGDPDKMPYLARQGWVRTSQDLDAGLARLNQFSFEMIDEGPTDDLALIEQRKAPLQTVETEDEGAADDVLNSSVPTPTPKSSPRSILKRLEQAPA